MDQKPTRAIVAAVQLPGASDVEFESSLAELRQLAKTLGFEVVGTLTQKRARLDAEAYLGTGKREELRALAQAGAEVVLVDHEISPSQAHNLAREIGCEVMDRSMVILEIFHRHARSAAARAQVEIARLGYMGPRLREAAKQAGPKDRARSGTGGRSGGESHGELDRRKIRDRIAELQKELDAMTLGRSTQRARRQERQGLARVALVGYTNAGKSTLMRALTGSEV
ncbi:MAG TPA: GTPase, partial [Burkholderiales bacterium]|nr:GTPase [Burkholderiales bacterium]